MNSSSFFGLILGLILLAAFFIGGGIVVRHMDRHPTWARSSSVSAAVRDHPRTVGACARGVLKSGAPLSREALARCWRVAAQAHVDRDAVGAKHALRRQMRAVARADKTYPTGHASTGLTGGGGLG